MNYLFEFKSTLSITDQFKDKLHNTKLATFGIFKTLRTSKAFYRKFQCHVDIICLIDATVKVVSTRLPALLCGASTIWKKKQVVVW